MNTKIYGCLGAASSIFYNVYVATSITKQGRTAISTSIMFFEQFLANNVKFGSLNEIVNFINKVKNEEHKYSDSDILDSDVSVESVFSKLMIGCGYNWLPDLQDCDLVWNIINQLDQTTLNRLYYKNNLYEFFENSRVKEKLIDILGKLESPFFDPNDPPETIKNELDELTSIVFEFVYYRYMIIDKLERVETMIRQAVLITDTDSCIISLDPWYKFVLNQINGIDIKVRHFETDSADIMKSEDINKVKVTEKQTYYDFYDDKLVEKERIVNPSVVIPQDGLRYSIINILAYIIGRLLKDYMERLTLNANSTDEKHHNFCLLSMKNEFLFKKVLLTSVKKNYVTLQEVQEGHLVPKEKQLDIKGLALRKSGVPDSITDELSRIIFEDVLDCENIDQNRILNELAVLERKICDHIRKGGIDYFKPQRIKPLSTYKDPMHIQGIKSSYAYNYIKDPSNEGINLEENNSILIIKTDIDKNKLASSNLKTEHPDIYNRMVDLISHPDYKGEITSIAIPFGSPTPEWLMEFIDYRTIVKDNISVFPIEPLGITKMGTVSPYSGILEL